MITLKVIMFFCESFNVRTLIDSWVGDVKSLSNTLFGKFKIGTELLIYNGIVTFIGLYLISKPQPVPDDVKTILKDGDRK